MDSVGTEEIVKYPNEIVIFSVYGLVSPVQMCHAWNRTDVVLFLNASAVFKRIYKQHLHVDVENMEISTWFWDKIGLPCKNLEKKVK